MHFAPIDSPSSSLGKRALPTLSQLPSNTFILDDSNATLIAYEAPFDIIRNSTCRGGTCTRLGASDATLSFNFTGTSVWLFGKPGGLARVFVDGQQEQRNLDSSDLPNDGSALWTKSGLASGKTHSIKLQGFQSADLNLVIDFFGVDGTVIPIGSSEDDSNSNSGVGTPSAKSMGVILGSIFAGLLVVSLLGVGLFIFFRRRKQNGNGGVWNKDISRPVMYGGKDGEASPTPFLSFNSRKSNEKAPQSQTHTQRSQSPSESETRSEQQNQPQPQNRYQPQPITNYQNLDRVQFNNSLAQRSSNNYISAYPPMPSTQTAQSAQAPQSYQTPLPPPPRPMVVIPPASTSTVTAKIPTPTRLLSRKRMRSDVPRTPRTAVEDSPIDLESTPLMEDIPFQIPTENNYNGNSNYNNNGNGIRNEYGNAGGAGAGYGYGYGYRPEPERQTVQTFSSLPTATTVTSVPSAPTTGSRSGIGAGTFGNSTYASSESASAYSRSQVARGNTPPQLILQPPSTATNSDFSNSTQTSNSTNYTPPNFNPPNFNPPTNPPNVNNFNNVNRNLNVESSPLARFGTPSPNVQQIPPPPYALFQQGQAQVNDRSQGAQNVQGVQGAQGRVLPELRNVGAEKVPRWVNEPF